MGNDVKVRIGLGVFICFLKKLYLKKNINNYNDTLLFFQTKKIFINTNLLKLITNTNQLTTILKHKISHTLLSHTIYSFITIIITIFYINYFINPNTTYFN